MKSSKKFRSAAAAAVAFIIALTFSAHAVEVVSVSVSSNPSTTSNYAPIAEKLSFTTYKDVAVHGEFAAVDPEGDLLSFCIATQPRKGRVEVSGRSFVYTPEIGKKGRDSFSYTAIDAAGNISDEATVEICIENAKVKLSYADMDGHEAEYAALRLAEAGIYVGEQIGSSYYFKPDETLSRGEFLALCLNTAGLEPLEGISRTGFHDDADIPAWEKAYVSTALMAGVVQGYSTAEGEIIFSASDKINGAEAMVMLNNALKITDVSEVSLSFTSNDAAPAWAAQAAANLSACSIVTGSVLPSAELTRGEAAKMLSASLDLIEERKENSGSLLSWAW